MHVPILWISCPVPGLSIDQGTNFVPTKSSLFHSFGIDKSYSIINPFALNTVLKYLKSLFIKR